MEINSVSFVKSSAHPRECPPMDKAEYALKLVAEGKLNLGVNNKNLEMEQMKLKNFRNNVVISFFGIVIVFLLVF